MTLLYDYYYGWIVSNKPYETNLLNDAYVIPSFIHAFTTARVLQDHNNSEKEKLLNYYNFFMYLFTLI